jgi:diguanylate cyclase (GGDEF)-like protein
VRARNIPRLPNMTSLHAKVSDRDMFRWRHCNRWPWIAQAAPTSTATADATELLAHTESLRTKDHPQFVRMLEQIRLKAPHLSSNQQWQLHYLDAWETAFQGDYVKAEGQLRNVIDHSGDMTLATKASALLMGNMAINHRYEEAFQLANQLVSDLPKTKDRLARFIVLLNLSQLLGSAGQNDLAIKYARMMEDALPPGETLCNPFAQEVLSLYYSKQLTSSSPELQRTIDTCRSSGQPVYANFAWLILASLYLDEGHPDKAMALLNQIAPSIRSNHYYPHMVAWQAELAQTYAKLSDEANARKAALAAVNMSSPGEISEPLRDAYDVLFRIEKKQGNVATALEYYERYVAQDKRYLNDVSARTLAYQVAQQQVATKKLETEELGKQNSILRLQQALDTKAVETSRLYIVLLLITLASIVLWLYRLKRSQLGFKRLSRHDGLTGIFNHQHFISEADRVLRLLEKKLGHACLISIDLDHFKQVNDTHGHVMGDAVLKHAVAICQQHLRPADLFGRLGGEEFGILLHECCRKQGMDIANRIRLAIEASPMEKDGCVISISASVGLASTDAFGYELLRLCTEADAALYRAKRAGRNRVIADTENDGNLVEA